MINPGFNLSVVNRIQDPPPLPRPRRRGRGYMTRNRFIRALYARMNLFMESIPTSRGKGGQVGMGLDWQHDPNIKFRMSHVYFRFACHQSQSLL
jgi:hypothetical protein